MPDDGLLFRPVTELAELVRSGELSAGELTDLALGRIAASCCGLVGLKPQRGRISHAPDLGEQFLSQDGVLTRTVQETAQLLDILAGPVPGDSSWAPPPPETFAASASREPGR